MKRKQSFDLDVPAHVSIEAIQHRIADALKGLSSDKPHMGKMKAHVDVIVEWPSPPYSNKRPCDDNDTIYS